ncbi:MAG: sulfite exporter TauE/SafE family protein [Polyangiaceae bacterium]|nr:sulfite exporter TauE/SafE family protein [Polyangiaceae bacterium]
MILVAVALALLVGVSLGLLGGGGSILTVPIFRYVLGMEAHRAVALSLLVVGTTSLAALVPHARKGRIRWRTALIFGAAGMVGAFVTGRIAHLIPAGVLLVAFGLMMLATAVAMLRGRSGVGPVAPRELPIAKVLGEGLVVGAVTGLVGAGGGFLVVPALVILGGLPMEVAVGTSLVVIALKSFAGFVGFLGHTPIDWTLAAWVSGAAVLGSIGGGALADRVSPARLRGLFGWFVVAMALFILGQELPPAFGLRPSVGLALGLAVLGTALAAAARHLLSPPKAAASLASGAAVTE